MVFCNDWDSFLVKTLFMSAVLVNIFMLVLEYPLQHYVQVAKPNMSLVKVVPEFSKVLSTSLFLELRKVINSWVNQRNSHHSEDHRPVLQSSVNIDLVDKPGECYKVPQMKQGTNLMNRSSVTRPLEFNVCNQRLAFKDRELVCLANGVHQRPFVLHHSWQHVERILDFVNLLALFVEPSSYLIFELSCFYLVLILQLKVLEYLLVTLPYAKDRIVVRSNALVIASVDARPFHVIKLVAEDVAVQ